MKILLKAAYRTLKFTSLRAWKRNTNDPLMKINCVRSVMVGVFNLVDGLIVILTLGFFKPEFATKFMIETMELRMEEDEKSSK